MYFIVFFFKQKTAYEMRISDWSSDVCSSDLNKNDILILLFAVNAYALVGFTIYAWADYHVHLCINKNARTGYITSFTRGQASLLESLNYLLRLLFDFFVPPLYGIYAMQDRTSTRLNSSP